MAGNAIQGAVDTDLIFFTFAFVVGGETRELSLKAICGPGDQGEPVITVLLPLED